MSNIITINKIATINYYEFDKDYSHIGESHNFWEMVYADKGELYVMAKDKEYQLKQGEAFFHKPNEWHTLRGNHTTAPNVFIITFVCHSRAMDFFKDKKVNIPAKHRHYISSIISETIESYDTTLKSTVFKYKKTVPIGGEQMIRTSLEQLLIMLIRCDKKQETHVYLPFEESIDNEIAKKVLMILHENIYSNITVEKICETLGYSKTHLSKIFLTCSGYTIGNFYNKLKIEEAKRLIRENNYNFSQISDLLSFSDPQYFSKVFRRCEGMSPREYFNSVKIG